MTSGYIYQQELGLNLKKRKPIRKWMSFPENHFSKLLLADLSGFERMYLFPFAEMEPLNPSILPCLAWR